MPFQTFYLHFNHCHRAHFPTYTDYWKLQVSQHEPVITVTKSHRITKWLRVEGTILQWSELPYSHRIRKCNYFEATSPMLLKNPELGCGAERTLISHTCLLMGGCLWYFLAPSFNTVLRSRSQAWVLKPQERWHFNEGIVTYSILLSANNNELQVDWDTLSTGTKGQRKL